MLSGMVPAVFGGSIAEGCRHFQNWSGLSLQTFVLLQSDVEHLAHQQGKYYQLYTGHELTA